MKESNDNSINIENAKKEDISLSTAKVNPETSILSSENIVASKINQNSETIKIKSEKKKSEFELHIVEAYKIITGFYQSKEAKNKNDNKLKNKDFQNDKMKIQLCENEMRIALNKCNESKNIRLNKNILDKISRISIHNQINILLILGKIFINLMKKEKLFEPPDNKIDLNNVILFINQICNLNYILKETYLGNKLNKISIKFIEKIIVEYHFEQDQIVALKHLIKLNNEKQKPKNLNLNSFEEMVISINDLLQSQDNYYMQYKILINNYNYIVGMINQTDFDESNYLGNYIELGKIFAYLLYNKKYVIFMKKQSNENEPQGVIKLLFDGYEDNYLLNVVEGEKYYIDYDEDIEEMREKICELILQYAEKYKSFGNIFEFQYVIYVLIKRVYFHYFEKFKEKIEPILSEIMINLCFFKIESVEEIKIFMNEILNSKDEKYNNLRNLLNRKIDFVKMNPNFQYHLPKNENGENNGSDYFISLDNISYETILLLESDLKLGYFLNKKIESGEQFCFYVELTEPYGLLDFCINIEQYNIKLSIINLTEGKEIVKSNEVNAITSPFKISMFFTKPVICKFIFDNSYSWIRDKTIKYKVNIFYPQEPFYIARQILLLKYQETIYNKKNFNAEESQRIKNEKIKENSLKNTFLVKFNGQNKAFNCSEVMQNIETSNKMLEDNFISINSIFIEKNNGDKQSYFYCLNNDGGLIKLELNKENFLNYLKDNILNKSKATIDLINLYIISGDSNIIDNHYINIEEILGFIPDIKVDGNNDFNNYKILFFLQYLHQAQLIYELFKNICYKESFDIVLSINYTKYGGYQICLYKDGEIFINPKNFKNINKNQSIEKNIELIAKEIKAYGEKRRVDILLMESIDSQEKEFDKEKIYELIKKNLKIDDEEESNYKIKKMDKKFNNEVSCNSHIFYLD